MLLAPDIDADVAAAKIFGVVSDPDLAYGAAPQPRKVFSGPGVHITSYVSWSDKALTKIVRALAKTARDIMVFATAGADAGPDRRNCKGGDRAAASSRLH